MLWRARRLRCGARPDLSGAWCSLPRSYVFHEDGNSSLMSVFIALMSAPAGASLKLPQATKLVPGRGFWPAMAPDGLPGASRSVMSGTIRCVFNYVRRVTSLGDGMIMPAAGCGPRPGRVLRPLAPRVAALARRGCAAGMRYPGYALGGGSLSRAAGDWLSGRAPRSHRGGHWFDPSIAHQPDLGVRPGPRLFAPVSSYFADETSGVSGRNLGDRLPVVGHVPARGVGVQNGDRSHQREPR